MFNANYDDDYAGDNNEIDETDDYDDDENDDAVGERGNTGEWRWERGQQGLKCPRSTRSCTLLHLNVLHLTSVTH